MENIETYKSFTIIINEEPDNWFTWRIRRPDGSTLKESEDEFDTEMEAVDDAKLYIDDWYENNGK